MNKWISELKVDIVIEGEKGPTPVRIGIYYYTVVVINAILALVLSQILG